MQRITLLKDFSYNNFNYKCTLRVPIFATSTLFEVQMFLQSREHRVLQNKQENPAHTFLGRAEYVCKREVLYGSLAGTLAKFAKRHRHLWQKTNASTWRTITLLWALSNG